MDQGKLMIDNYAIKIDANPQYAIHHPVKTDDEPSSNLIENTTIGMIKVSEDTFDYIDMDRSKVPGFIYAEYCNKDRKKWQPNTGEFNQNLTYKIRIACAEVAHCSRIGWPNNIIANPKFKELFDSCDDLYKWSQNPWDISYDEHVDDIMIVFKKSTGNNNVLWYNMMFYKELDDGRIRLFYNSKNSSIPTISSYSFVTLV
jgi:hypothetical protein